MPCGRWDGQANIDSLWSTGHVKMTASGDMLQLNYALSFVALHTEEGYLVALRKWIRFLAAF